MSIKYTDRPKHISLQDLTVATTVTAYVDTTIDDTWAANTITDICDHGHTITNTALARLTEDELLRLMAWDHVFTDWLAAQRYWDWFQPLGRKSPLWLSKENPIPYCARLVIDPDLVVWIDDMPAGIELSASKELTALRRYRMIAAHVAWTATHD